MKFDSKYGTYALVLQLSQNHLIKVGVLGVISFQAGYYVYVGSAFGSGGLQARLAHHLTPAPRPHWHIDYLRQQADILDIWFTYDPTRREHEWAYVFSTMTASKVPFPRFGVSDCQCQGHLFYFQSLPDIGQFTLLLRKQYPGHEAVQRVLPSILYTQR